MLLAVPRSLDCKENFSGFLAQEQDEATGINGSLPSRFSLHRAAQRARRRGRYFPAALVSACAVATADWSSLLSWWDWLHRTMRLDIEQDELEVGVAAYQRPEDVTLGKITALPFRKQRTDWTALDGTSHESRGPLALAERHDSLENE